MAKISGGIPVTSFISPTDDTDTFATHNEEYGKGGYRTVDNATERQAITFERRKIGMLVKQIDTGIFWTLTGGIENANWQVVSFTSDDEKNKIALIDNTGDGTTFLSDDGTYKGVGETTDYTSSQYTIDVSGDYNLISSNMCMGKAVTIDGGTSNTEVNNKYE